MLTGVLFVFPGQIIFILEVAKPLPENCIDMIIDDDGKKWSLIQITTGYILKCYAINKKRKRTEHTARWTIHPDTHWNTFRDELADEIREWKKVLYRSQDKEIVLELCHNEQK